MARHSGEGGGGGGGNQLVLIPRKNWDYQRDISSVIHHGLLTSTSSWKPTCDSLLRISWRVVRSSSLAMSTSGLIHG